MGIIIIKLGQHQMSTLPLHGMMTSSISNRTRKIGFSVRCQTGIRSNVQRRRIATICKKPAFAFT
jgi:hypothetical protein